ncbi:MAG: hypothetical protein J0M17_10420, partial [Planctomycetes bacterium]|nr:hypothetical protein [Planctomycetota bacterium]
MTLRRFISTSLLTALGFAPSLAPASQLGDYVKTQVQRKVQQQQQQPQQAKPAAGAKVAVQTPAQSQKFKFPNGNTGVVGPKIVNVPTNKLPGGVIVTKPGNQGINPKVGIPIVPGIVVKPGGGGGGGKFNPGQFVPKP